MDSRLTVALALWLSAFVVHPTGADEDADHEMKRLQGRFERTVTNAAGTKFRVVKEIADDQSTVTTLDDEGHVIEATRSTFKVEKRGPVRVFTFSDKKVTAGPNKGETVAGKFSYIYRMDDDTFTEVWGLLEDDKSTPRMFTWRRVMETK